MTNMNNGLLAQGTAELYMHQHIDGGPTGFTQKREFADHRPVDLHNSIMQSANYGRARASAPSQNSCQTSSMLSHRTVLLRRVHCAANVQTEGLKAVDLSAQQQEHLEALQQVFTPLEVDRLISSRQSVLDLPTADWLRFFDGYGLSKGAMWKTLRCVGWVGAGGKGGGSKLQRMIL
jgi:hypothetical protein